MCHDVPRPRHVAAVCTRTLDRVPSATHPSEMMSSFLVWPSFGAEVLGLVQLGAALARDSAVREERRARTLFFVEKALNVAHFPPLKMRSGPGRVCRCDGEVVNLAERDPPLRSAVRVPFAEKQLPCCRSGFHGGHGEGSPRQR